jgi:glycerol-3-phosphate dehydrogenase
MISGQSFQVRGDIVLNAAGPWAAALLEGVAAAGSNPAPRLSRAMNLIVRRVQVAQACGGRATGRFLFLAPWRDVTLVGTSHDVHEGSPDALMVSRADIDAFVNEVHEAFPHADLSSHDVRLVHRGLLPMVSGNGRDVTLLRESTVVDHAVDGVPGLVSMFGVRYTTARATAQLAVDTVFRARGVQSPPPCRTAITPVTGGAIGDKHNFVRAASLRRIDDMPRDMLARIATTYGTNYDAVLRSVRDDPSLAQPLGTTCSVSGAEIEYAFRHEAAVRLSDALIRRTEAGSAGHPGADVVARAAAIAARVRGWDASRVAQEIDDVEAFYRIPN